MTGHRPFAHHIGARRVWSISARGHHSQRKPEMRAKEIYGTCTWKVTRQVPLEAATEASHRRQSLVSLPFARWRVA